MELSKFLNEEIFGSHFKLISLMTALAAAMLYTLSYQAGWAAVINCPGFDTVCNGTSGDDIIFGSREPSISSVINGLEGKDYIIARGGDTYIYGDDGDDILIGGRDNDGLYGGRGNDKYDGGFGDDIIVEYIRNEGTLVNNDDIISGGEGDDWISSGEGADRINGGPGNDIIYPNAGELNRDFSYDIVNCGFGTGDEVRSFYSADGETATNCETVTDYDR